ncbi:MAG TPA: hypothetical protein PK095_17200 [Myxococcota bacterium]|nr:hypothetical protein [Myxococcota bacterium]
MMLRHVFVWLGLLLGACAEGSHPGESLDVTDTSEANDTSDTAETRLETSDADADEVGLDTSETDLQDGNLGPIEPLESSIALDWALQTGHSPESWFGWPTATLLDDGSLVVAGQFNGALELDGLSVDSGDDDPYTHAVAARITPEGIAADLRRLCERCLSGTTPLIALAGGRYAFAAAVDGELVFEPGTPNARVVRADHQLLVAIVGVNGQLEDHALVARVAEGAEVRALAATPGGGLAIGGSTWALALDDGPAFEAEEGWHYPGRAFVVVVDSELRPRYAEQLGGQAGSTVGMLRVDGETLDMVGDFGGYPLGVETTFNEGLASATTLTSVSSDDDPAMDLFVARWTLPVLSEDDAPTRPRLVWARRFANYQNGPRQPTWLRGTSERGLELRVDGAGRLEVDGEHYALPRPERPEDGWTSVVVRLTSEGEASLSFVANGTVLPSRDGGFLSAATFGSGLTYRPQGEGGPSFAVPPATTGVDGTVYQGHVLARWRSDGALIEAGLLLTESPASYWPPTLQHLVPRADGAVYLVLHGSAPVTLAGSGGTRFPLLREANYERVVVIGARLVRP